MFGGKDQDATDEVSKALCGLGCTMQVAHRHISQELCSILGVTIGRFLANPEQDLEKYLTELGELPATGQVIRDAARSLSKLPGKLAVATEIEAGFATAADSGVFLQKVFQFMSLDVSVCPKVAGWSQMMTNRDHFLQLALMQWEVVLEEAGIELDKIKAYGNTLDSVISASETWTWEAGSDAQNIFIPVGTPAGDNNKAMMKELATWASQSSKLHTDWTAVASIVSRHQHQTLHPPAGAELTMVIQVHWTVLKCTPSWQEGFTPLNPPMSPPPDSTESDSSLPLKAITMRDAHIVWGGGQQPNCGRPEANFS